MRYLSSLIVFASLGIIGSAFGGTTDDSTLWRMTFDSGWLGPVETRVEITLEADRLTGRSLSGAAALLAELPGDHDISDGLLVFEAGRQEDGSYKGTFTAPWRKGDLTLTISDQTIEGSVQGGAFNGAISGYPADSTGPIRDYRAILEAFDAVVASRIFSPEDLEAPGYVAFRESLGRIAAAATDDLDITLGFHWAWNNDPFSHFELRRSRQTAEQMFTYFDGMRVGFEAATVEFRDDIAVLKVRTMMGADTIEQIEAAYTRIAEVGPKTLIIDLRGNSGGAFAVKPLIEHVIDEPLDAGFFLSQVWNRDHDRPPTTEEALASPPWQGWSIIAFWHAVQASDILRIRFYPAEPNFDGPVYVLLDQTAASATELAADALRASGLTTSIGTRTAGRMLSQSMFDVADGFVVSLPVADYYSLAHGRIEGAGVPTDIEIDPAAALDKALELAASN